MALQTLLGQSLIQVRGYPAPWVQQAFNRARELIVQIGETGQYFQVLYGLYTYYLLRAEYQSASEVGEQFLEAAQHTQDPVLLHMGRLQLGIVMFYKGEQVPAQEHLLQAIPSYDIQQHRSLALIYGQEPFSTGLCFLARSLWLLGYPDQAAERIQAAVSLAQDVAHPFSLAFVNTFATMHYILSGPIELAQHYTDAVLDLANEQSFAGFQVSGQTLQGACWPRIGRTQEASSSLTQGLIGMSETGNRAALPQYSSWLGEAHIVAGKGEDGLKALAEALAHVNETGGRHWEADLCRVKGELLLLPGGSASEAEGCLNQALEVARKQSAKSLELRAAMSMARLWQRQGKDTEARELPAGIYGWFTEGFETADLIGAKALLEELS